MWQRVNVRKTHFSTTNVRSYIFLKTTLVCLFQNTNFLGGGLPESEGGQGIQTKDVDECDQECRNRGRCQYWTFVGDWQINCYLKSSLGEKTEFDGGVSGTYGSNCGMKHLQNLQHSHLIRFGY